MPPAQLPHAPARRRVVVEVMMHQPRDTKLEARSRAASEPARPHHRETLVIANPCCRLSEPRKGDLFLSPPRLAGQKRPHVVLRAVVDGAACAAVEIKLEDEQVVG